jgi:DNA gyrase subunit A
MPIDTFREQKRGGQGVTGVKLKKEDDAIKSLYTASMHDYLLIFTTHGRCLWLKVWQIPEGSRTAKGKPLINLLEGLQENERIATILKTRNFQEEADIIMATEKGVVKRSELSNFSNPRKRGIIALAIDEGDALIAARLIGKGEKAMLFTYHGMAVRFDESKVRSMGRLARGVRGAKLKDEGDRIIALEVVKGTESILVVCENGFGKRSSVEDFRETNRASSGVRSIITSERNGNVVGALSVEDTDSIVLMSASGQTVRINMKDVRVMGRNTQGVKLVNVKEGDSLVSVQKLTTPEAILEETPAT